jgi:hypothetical protein
VIAFCKPINSANSANWNKTTYFFDGTQWVSSNSFDTNATYEQFTMTVDSNSALCNTSISGTNNDITRAYTGHFDRISLYTRDFTSTTYTVIDDLSVVGGNIVPEPASLILLALGSMLLRRRVG